MARDRRKKKGKRRGERGKRKEKRKKGRDQLGLNLFVMARRGGPPAEMLLSARADQQTWISRKQRTQQPRELASLLSTQPPSNECAQRNATACVSGINKEDIGRNPHARARIKNINVGRICRAHFRLHVTKSFVRTLVFKKNVRRTYWQCGCAHTRFQKKRLPRTS